MPGMTKLHSMATGFYDPLAAGQPQPPSGQPILNADGSLDTSFDPGTGVEELVVHPQVHAVALHADGRIVIGGFFKNVNGVPRDGIAQLDADGSVDLTFNPGTGLQTYVALAVAALTNGQVLVGGIFDKVNGVPRKSLARLNADGSVDASFSVPNGGIGGSNALERVYALAVQPDGRVIIGGDFTIVANGRGEAGAGDGVHMPLPPIDGGRVPHTPLARGAAPIRACER